MTTEEYAKQLLAEKPLTIDGTYVPQTQDYLSDTATKIWTAVRSLLDLSEGMSHCYNTLSVACGRLPLLLHTFMRATKHPSSRTVCGSSQHVKGTWQTKPPLSVERWLHYIADGSTFIRSACAVSRG